MSTSERERTEILGAIRKQVLKHHNAGETEAFETGVQELLEGLGCSHTVFYHESVNRFLPQHTINASVVSTK